MFVSVYMQLLVSESFRVSTFKLRERQRTTLSQQLLKQQPAPHSYTHTQADLAQGLDS